MKIFQINSPIANQQKILPGYFRLTFFAPKIAQVAKPGQFVHIYCDGDTYLRRPFSIAGVEKNQVEIVYKVVGKGTMLLSQKRKGEILDVIGPLGTGFSLSTLNPAPACRSGVNSQLSTILIAGGTGVASLLFLAYRLSTYKLMNLSTVVLIGAKTKNDLLCVSDFKKLGCQVKLATEDGSLGFRGLVTNLFRSSLIPHNSSFIPAVFACGPYQMLKKIAEICEKREIKCQVSLENIMACGIGACRGCVVRTRIAADEKQSQVSADVVARDKVPKQSLQIATPFGLAMTKATQITADRFQYKTVCKDGPVFEAKEIVWE